MHCPHCHAPHPTPTDVIHITPSEVARIEKGSFDHLPFLKQAAIIALQKWDLKCSAANAASTAEQQRVYQQELHVWQRRRNDVSCAATAAAAQAQAAEDAALAADNAAAAAAVAVIHSRQAAESAIAAPDCPSSIQQQDPSPAMTHSSPPDNATYAQLKQFGAARYADSDVSGAVAAWERCLALTPTDIPINLNLSLAYCSLGQFQAAVETATTALAGEPNNPKALYRRAEAYSQLGQLVLARADLSALPTSYKLQGSVALLIQDVTDRLSAIALAEIELQQASPTAPATPAQGRGDSCPASRSSTAAPVGSLTGLSTQQAKPVPIRRRIAVEVEESSSEEDAEQEVLPPQPDSQSRSTAAAATSSSQSEASSAAPSPPQSPPQQPAAATPLMEAASCPVMAEAEPAAAEPAAPAESESHPEPAVAAAVPESQPEAAATATVVSSGEDLREQGNGLYKQQRYEEAVVAYNVCIQADPQDTRAYCNMALAHIKLQQFQQVGGGSLRSTTLTCAWILSKRLFYACCPRRSGPETSASKLADLPRKRSQTSEQAFPNFLVSVDILKAHCIHNSQSRYQCNGWSAC